MHLSPLIPSLTIIVIYHLDFIDSHHHHQSIIPIIMLGSATKILFLYSNIYILSRLNHRSVLIISHQIHLEFWTIVWITNMPCAVLVCQVILANLTCKIREEFLILIWHMAFIIHSLSYAQYK